MTGRPRTPEMAADDVAVSKLLSSISARLPLSCPNDQRRGAPLVDADTRQLEFAKLFSAIVHGPESVVLYSSNDEI